MAEEGSSSLGTVHKVDCESLNNLIEEYEKVLEDNLNKKGEFEKFRKDYVNLRKRIKTLPDKLEYDAVVPLCSKAMCHGKIVHTNEILVLLGENTFVECTAKNAAEIITHRLKSIDEKVIRLDKEQELYINWKMEAERQMVETLGSGTIEIMEDYDEDQEKEWRKTHREKVRKYYQELAKEKLNAKEKGKDVKKDDGDLWNRLDALELEEEFMEAQALYEEQRNEITEQKEHQYTAKIRERQNLSLKTEIEESSNDNGDNESAVSSRGKKVTFSPENVIHNLTDLKVLKKKGDSGEKELYKPSNELIAENGETDPIFIRFRHEPPSSSDEDDLVTSDSESDSDDDDTNYQIVISPSDIYEQFGPTALEAKAKAATIPGADKVPLKSILKPRVDAGSEKKSKNKSNAGDNNNVVKKALCVTESVLASEVAERLPNHHADAVYSMFPGLAPVAGESTDQIKETDVDVQKADKDRNQSDNKPVSLFKLRRAKSNEGALPNDSDSD